MTDPDERTINCAIAMLDDTTARYARMAHTDVQDIREKARAALHRLFRDRRRLENEVASWAQKYDQLLMQYGTMGQDNNDLRAELARLREDLNEARAELECGEPHSAAELHRMEKEHGDETDRYQTEIARLREGLRDIGSGDHIGALPSWYRMRARQLIEETDRV